MRPTKDFLPTQSFSLPCSVAPWHPHPAMLQLDPTVRVVTYLVMVRDGKVHVKIPTVDTDWDLAKTKGD